VPLFYIHSFKLVNKINLNKINYLYQKQKIIIIKSSMSLNNSSTFSSQLSEIDENLLFPSDSNGSENNHIGPGSIRNFFLDSFEEIQYPNLSLNHSNSISSMIDLNPMPFGNEVRNIFPNAPINSNKQSDSVTPSDNSIIETKDESKPVLDKEKEKENFLGKKRAERQRKRKKDKDDMRVKIKRAFYNISLRNKLNGGLKSIGSKKYFEKFPKHFASDANKKRNKEILDMTLNQIFEKKELYIYEDDCGKAKFLHNLKTVQNEEIKKSEVMQKILNKTFRELYEEYINSDEFKIDEIKRLKKTNVDEYIKKYKDLAENLIEFFSH